MNRQPPRIALTPGEPAGIGPDLCLMLAQRAWPAELVLVADGDMLARRSAQLGLKTVFRPYQASRPAAPAEPGTVTLCDQRLNATEVAGDADPRNASYVLACLDRACDGCLAGEFAAMVTGPVHKGVINEAGIPFTGHTEYLAARCEQPDPVMLLVADDLRVALVTTHLPLREVPDRITRARIRHVAGALQAGLRDAFGIAEPRILVLGLNPHAGESGHLGTEERDVIEPALAELRAEGMRVEGPLPADTAFTPPKLAQADAVLAMFHDQGLTVLKHRGFGRAVNLTLGLPIVRTSVDHGTALELAGTGQAEAGSFAAALELALRLSQRRES